jgi:hypothetical protein
MRDNLEFSEKLRESILNGASVSDIVQEIEDLIKPLLHHKDTTVGLFAIDRNPNDVSLEWIRENSFQISE